MLEINNSAFYKMPAGLVTRWASPENPRAEKGRGGMAKGGRKGRESIPLNPGEQAVLAEEKNTSGIIRRIWSTIDDRSPEMLRGLRLDIYWDNSSKPAVSAPFGDFFGNGLGRMATFQSALFASPEGKSFNCFIPMPFKTAMKIVVTNESGKRLGQMYYDIDYTVGDDFTDNTLYFHAHYRRENPTTLRKDYEILPKLHGKGRFLGANMGIIADTGQFFDIWWGEGECKIYIDDDEEFPSLCGTGTEDYIGTGWGLDYFVGPYQGCHLADFEKQQFCIYRYHIPDPVYFYKNIKVTIQQLGCWGPGLRQRMHECGRTFYHAGPEMTPIDFSPESDIEEYGLFERQDDWSSCAYFYLDSPENNLPPIDDVSKRLMGLTT